ncbi:MAG: hypothetical protein N3B01_09630, partial [Verrucomicrobiae bacterium]|nr:hypothetical protein [Verrucomicrobiae bacterium]
MTTTAIHPAVLEKLRRFGRRRRRLILVRGLCSTAAIWLATMTTVALLDRAMLLEDGVRAGLSFFGYAATAAVFWQTCARQLLHLPTARELARLLEAAAPPLREQLLAAVELAETSRQPHWDSDEFRAAVQQIAARKLAGLSVESLLTPRLIARWLYAAAATTVAVLTLFAVPRLNFEQAFARAALPLANLARPSNLQIEVLTPSPPDHTVPEGDPVPITVRISGGEPSRVILETFPQRGQRERKPMSLSGPAQFAAAVPVDTSEVRYRVRAGDAVTRKFLLQPVPRPQVLRFHKTYRYPPYTQLTPRTVTEANGDLEAVEGTEVELKLEANQPIREAALRIDLAKTTKHVPLQPLPNGQLLARLPLTTDGTYRVHLVATATGFENKYSPQYEIRVRPDLLPTAKIESPQEEHLVLPPDAVIQLSGTASDDIGLRQLQQAFQINHGAWQTIPLAPGTGTNARISCTWDLFALGLHPGDRLITKLVATDLKGQHGESVPLRILIATPGFDPQRHARLKAKQTVERALQQLRQATDQLDQKWRAARTTLASRSTPHLQKQQALTAALAVANTAAEKALDTLQQ